MEKINPSISLNFQLKDDFLLKTLLKDKDLRFTFTITMPSGEVKIYNDCSYIMGMDGKSILWFNDEHEGTLVVK